MDNGLITSILSSAWWLIIALGLLVSFHEFGHFWVARKMGVKVLTFSIGYGGSLFSWRDRLGTEYRLATLPLGGYVKMLDEREGNVPKEQAHVAFNNKSLGARTAIVAAGPVFNLIFALLAFWLMFVSGVQEIRPILGETTGIAARAGLMENDRIIEVDGVKTESWTHVIMQLISPALDKEDIEIKVQNEYGDARRVQLALSLLPDDFQEDQLMQGIGLSSWRPTFPPVIGSVSDNSPAMQAGLKPGDRIVAINTQAIDQWADVGENINAELENTATGKALQLMIMREGQEQSLLVTPKKQDDRYIIGIGPQLPDASEVEEIRKRHYFMMHYDPVSAIGMAFSESWRYTEATLGIIWRMISGKASLQNLSGPISIAQFARNSADLGFERFLSFLGILSLSLAILNLLPIPVLDGGHLLYFLVEFVRGKPVSEQTQITGQYIGMALLFSLMVIAFYNDILRTFSG